MYVNLASIVVRREARALGALATIRKESDLSSSNGVHAMMSEKAKSGAKLRLAMMSEKAKSESYFCKASERHPEATISHLFHVISISLNNYPDLGVQHVKGAAF